MFDLGWLEILIIGVTALIVVGPKDLPKVFKKVGVFVGKARGMAREFQRGMEDAADESGLKEASKILETVNSVKEDPTGLKKRAVDDFFVNTKSSNSTPGKFTSTESAVLKEAKPKVTKSGLGKRKKTSVNSTKASEKTKVVRKNSDLAKEKVKLIPKDTSKSILASGNSKAKKVTSAKKKRITKNVTENLDKKKAETKSTSKSKKYNLDKTK